MTIKNVEKGVEQRERPSHFIFLPGVIRCVFFASGQECRTLHPKCPRNLNEDGQRWFTSIRFEVGDIDAAQPGPLGKLSLRNPYLFSDGAYDTSNLHIHSIGRIRAKRPTNSLTLMFTIVNILNMNVVSPDWIIDLLDDGFRHADEGREVLVNFRHSESGRRIEATVVYYWNSRDAVVAQILHDDLLLPEHTARRLLARLCVRYMRTVGDFGDCGLTTTCNLEELALSLYRESCEGEAVIALVHTAIRTFGKMTNGEFA